MRRHESGGGIKEIKHVQGRCSVRRGKNAGALCRPGASQYNTCILRLEARTTDDSGCVIRCSKYRLLIWQHSCHRHRRQCTLWTKIFRGSVAKLIRLMCSWPKGHGFELEPGCFVYSCERSFTPMTSVRPAVCKMGTQLLPVERSCLSVERGKK